MQKSGPRRYSKLDLCTTRQLEHLAEEFCYDLDTLQNIATALAYGLAAIEIKPNGQSIAKSKH